MQSIPRPTTPKCSADRGPSLVCLGMIGACIARCQVGAFLLRQARRDIGRAFGLSQRRAAA
jgi:hypothetical protein